MFVPAVPLALVKIAHSGEAVVRGSSAHSCWPDTLTVCPNAKYACSEDLPPDVNYQENFPFLMSHLRERLSSFRFKYVWRENVFFTSASETCMKQTLLQILPVFGRNPEAGQKPLVNEGRKCDVSGDFFGSGVGCFGLVWGGFFVVLFFLDIFLLFPEICL